MTKLTADQFKRITGWQGRTNEHAREMGLTAGAVWQMVRDNRDIVLEFDESGKLVSWTNAQKRNPRR